MVQDPAKVCFQPKIMSNTVYDEKCSSQARLDSKRIFDNKWLIFSKTQVLSQSD